MIQFFPTPYPDELWYSILCRYHIRSGNTSSAITMRELFNGGKNAIGCLFPNHTILKIAEQFPGESFPLNEIVYNHTLFNYFTRIISHEAKEKMFQYLIEGHSLMPQYAGTVSKRLVPGLRFCPICIKEDKSKYGEAYWHLEHQIPLMSICRKHTCRLSLFSCNREVELKIKFLLPENCNENIIADYNINDKEILLAEESYKYQYFPQKIKPILKYNNIYQELLNKDYGIEPYNRIVDGNNLKKELVSFYGTDLVEKVFGKKINSAIMKSIRIWQYQSPERYILLAGLINQPFEITFGPQIEDNIVEKLLKIKERGNVFLKKDILDELGISARKLNILVEKYNIDQFWVRIKKRCSATVYMNESEYETILNYMRKESFTTISKFALYCMKKEINQHILSEKGRVE